MVRRRIGTKVLARQQPPPQLPDLFPPPVITTGEEESDEDIDDTMEEVEISGQDEGDAEE